MRIDDRYVGLILVALGITVFLVARTFPLMAGMPYGPGFFPSIAAVGLCVCGSVIAVSRGLIVRAASATQPAAPMAAAPKAGLLRPFLICLLVVFFALALPVLGFHITATIVVGAAALVFGGHPLAAPVLALAAAFCAHAVFYSLLRVPLPWGVLTPVAW